MAKFNTSASKPVLCRTWAVLATLFAFHIAFTLVLNPTGAGYDQISELPALMLMGALFCQPALFAIWAAIGPGRAVLRIPLSLAASTIVGFANAPIALNVFVSRPRPAEEIINALAISTCCFAVVLVIFLIVRRLSHWRIEWPTGIATTSDSRTQFSLKYLLGLTTLSCVILVIGRLLTPEQLSTDAASWRSTIANVLLFGGTLLLGLLPIFVFPLIALSPNPSLRFLIGMVFAWAAFTWLAVEILVAQSGTRYEAAKAIVLLQCGATAIGVVSAIAIRVAGYRLSKVPGR